MTSINHFGSMEEITQNFARLRETPKDELTPMQRAQAEADAHRDTRNAVVEQMAKERTPQGEVSHCANLTSITGIACSPEAKLLLADLFAVPMPEIGRGR